MKKWLVVLFIFVFVGSSAFAIDSSRVAHSDDDKCKISLGKAIELALEGNIELQEQRKNLGIAQNNIKKADALKNPQVNAAILAGRISRGNSSTVGVTFPFEVLKRGARKQSAIVERSYIENKVRDYEFKLQLRVRTSYFNLVLAKSNLKVMEERKALLEDLLEVALAKPKNSTNYEIDVLQADMRLKKQLVKINIAKANVRSAQYTFNRVLNLANNMSLYDAQEDTIFSDAISTTLELPSYEELEEIAFANRYDIRMAEARLEKAKRDITVEMRKRVPDFYLSGGYAFAFDGTPGGYVGGGIDLPTLYRFTPEIKNAKLEYEKAQLEYNSIINITKNVIHTNHDKFVMAQENVRHYKDILAESNKILQLSKARYQKGESSLTNLIVVEHSHQELLNEILVAAGAYYNSYIDLLKEIGLKNITLDVDL